MSSDDCLDVEVGSRGLGLGIRLPVEVVEIWSSKVYTDVSSVRGPRTLLVSKTRRDWSISLSDPHLRRKNCLRGETPVYSLSKLTTSVPPL